MAATLFVQPLDLIKFRMQLSGEGGGTRDYKTSIEAFKVITQKEGVIGLYSGLSANLFRQATYTTMRFGIYQGSLDHMEKFGYSGFVPQVFAGTLAGLFGSLIATPSDVPLVRMTANGKLPLAERRNYKNVFDALSRIAKEEGTRGLYAGAHPTVLRGVVANVTQLVSYSQAKHFLIDNEFMEDNIKCHFISSLFSGLVYSFLSCPFDVAKTRMQYMKTETGSPLYSGVWDVMSKTVHKEGISALWKGFGPLYVRAAPHTVILFIFMENLTTLYKTSVLDISEKGSEV